MRKRETRIDSASEREANDRLVALADAVWNYRRQYRLRDDGHLTDRIFATLDVVDRELKETRKFLRKRCIRIPSRPQKDLRSFEYVPPTKGDDG